MFKKILIFLLIVSTGFFGCEKSKEIYDSKAPKIDSPEWYKEVVFYQIYPRSFKDSDGDGIGDLKGIIEELDYLEDLGVGGIWLNPIYPSPLVDLGYDVSDYKNIHPDLGTMSDFLTLLDEAHKRNIRVFIDGVFNHTSDEHEWFIASRNREPSKVDWYIWAPQPYFDCRDVPYIPGAFSPSRWTRDPVRGEFYFHRFYSRMPDLNYKNSQVQEAILDVMKFWLDKGVDGFRLDVADSYFEDELNSLCLHQKETHEFLKKMRELFNRYENRAMVGEVWGLPSKINEYLGNGNDELHMIFNFFLYFPLAGGALLGGGEMIYSFLEQTYMKFPPGGWHAIVLGNHDLPRIFWLLGEDINKAKIAAFLQMTLPGTPFIYYGDEIGMTNGQNIVVDRRDGARTPMQWNCSENGGFTEGRPWLSLSPNYRTNCVEREKEEEDSLYNFYRRLIRMRNALTPLRAGGFEPLKLSFPEIVAYLRFKDENDWVMVVLNLSPRTLYITVNLKGTLIENFRGKLIDLLNDDRLIVSSSGVNLTLRGYSFHIYRQVED